MSPAGSVQAIDRYNPVTDEFEVIVHFDGDWGWWPSFNNPDFTRLEPGQGYYFDTGAGTTWVHEPNTDK